MKTRIATCACGQLRATCRGEPVRVSVCHCLECQRRSGSAFAIQARWPDADIEISGETRIFERVGASGRKFSARFCPNCGSTVAFAIEAMPGVTAIPVGAFADPGFPAPQFSVYEERKYSWVAVTGDHVEHMD